MSMVLHKKHQRILKALMKQPENARCADCGEQSAANVDVTHSTFVCTNCAGLHREFGDRIKSVSMASFTPEEVETLQKVTNEDVNAVWLAKWSPGQMKINADASDGDRRAFLRAKYVEKRWYSESGGGRSHHAPRPAPVEEPAPRASPFQQQQPQAQASPFQRQQQQPQVNPFMQGQPSRPAAKQQQQQNVFAQAPQPQRQQQQDLFAQAPRQQQQQQQPQQSLFGDDLLDMYEGENEQKHQVVQQEVQERKNNLKGLMDLIGPDQPPAGTQVNPQALRQAGLGGPAQPMGMGYQPGMAMGPPMGYRPQPGMGPMAPMGYPQQQPMGYPQQQQMGFQQQQMGFQQQPMGYQQPMQRQNNPFA